MRKQNKQLPGTWKIQMDSRGNTVVSFSNSVTPDVVAGLAIAFARTVANLLHTDEAEARTLLALSYKELS